MGKRSLLLLVALTLPLALGSFVSADNSENSDYMMVERTKEAADAQLQLSDRGFTYNEVKEQLSPFYTDQFIDQFITINMVKENDGLYYVMGTDFPIYYIPFFSYEGSTWVITDTNHGKTAVYEFFPAASDGPVGYDDHYEAVVYTSDNGVWKVTEVLPQFDPNQFETAAKGNINTLNATEISVQSKEFVKDDDREAALAERGVNILQMIKSFFLSLFGS